MLTSISPLGERARGNRWAVTVTAYVVASVLGGLTTGAAVGAIGSLADVPVLVAAAVCAVAAAADLVHRLPTIRRQVDEDWLTRYRGWVYGVGYGYQLGLGLVTIVTSAATYATVALCLLSGSPVVGAAIGTAFGLVRALPILLLRSADTPDRLRSVAATLERLAAVARRATAVVLAGAAVALAVTA
ncbi:MAG: hypothetical protein QOE99_1930 [Actinomycetota bacterium]|nr:hypothetical protein [Actinomycetota bacterium]